MDTHVHISHIFSTPRIICMHKNVYSVTNKYLPYLLLNASDSSAIFPGIPQPIPHTLYITTPDCDTSSTSNGRTSWRLRMTQAAAKGLKYVEIFARVPSDPAVKERFCVSFVCVSVKGCAVFWCLGKHGRYSEVGVVDVSLLPLY